MTITVPSCFHATFASAIVIESYGMFYHVIPANLYGTAVLSVAAGQSAGGIFGIWPFNGY